MKVKELLEAEQLDELIPRMLGGTGVPGMNNNMPGTTNPGRGRFTGWVKKKTGMGTGGQLLKQAAQASSMMYKQWLAMVPTLQQTGRIQAGDNESYINNLMQYVQKKLKITDAQTLSDFKDDIGITPNRTSIKKAFEKAYQNTMLQKQVGAKPQQAQPQQPQQTQTPKATAKKPKAGDTVNYNGKIYTWTNKAWRNGSDVLGGSDSKAAMATFRSTP